MEIRLFLMHVLGFRAFLYSFPTLLEVSSSLQHSPQLRKWHWNFFKRLFFFLHQHYYVLFPSVVAAAAASFHTSTIQITNYLINAKKKVILNSIILLHVKHTLLMAQYVLVKMLMLRP